MRVGINAVHLVPDSGEDDLFLRLSIQAVHESYPEIEFVIFTDSINNESFDMFPRHMLDLEGWSARRSGGGHALRAAIKEEAIDVLFSPLGTAPEKAPCPVVPFVTELHPLQEAEGLGSWWRRGRFRELQRIIRKSKALVAPSEYARRRLLDWLGIPLDKVVVARPGGDHLPQGEFDSVAEPPFLLSVGQTNHYRQIDVLLQAVERLREQIPHTLVLVGQSGDAERNEWGSRVLRIHQCPREQLAGLYQHCDLVICPHHQDASAMAAIEALRAGAVLVAPRTGAIPEVARSVPTYFDPTGHVAMANAIRFGLEESANRRDYLRRAGQQATAERTWANCAERLVVALRRR